MHKTKLSATILAASLLTLPISDVASAEVTSGQVSQQSEAVETTEVNLGQENVMSVAWYQNATEAKALYAQGYNTAKESLSEKIKKHKGGKKLAIALDIDETVLDNSPYQGYNALYNKSFPEGWHEWVSSAQAKPVYGAKDFLDYAHQHDVEIFYISDRSHEKDLNATIKNLKKEKLPQADKKHVLLKKEGEHGKSERRDQVRNNYNLVMLFGDNLLDFDEPKAATPEARDTFLKQHEDDFGSKYIIFPNPMYGSWESTLYQNDYSIDAHEKDQLRKESIQFFNPQNNKVQNYQLDA
ncbi:5'-nucleotidase, lipoprotein e(P4) family [Staphylococcus canis]|uniref:5'-nucleotidase, lipoprotein e(P4) family n=1 Tax=Staphylococcus canis TaxID=2724942 RepID=A0ABS0TBF6_9STAP|nr:5'-nucleotidase, lipoprotein e(P4) family [Staphylococcus canis]MBI5975291.1 5'-nucleotidase, lipoprotein e(P4) family [Staphylococcus canis]